MAPSTAADTAQVERSSRTTHVPALTSVRGLAAWWVVFFHFKYFLAPYLPQWGLAFISRGELAVDLFFCLSGFVLYLNYHKLALEPRPALRFYVKRVARIYPLHLLFLLAYCGLGTCVLMFSSAGTLDSRYSAGSFVANLLLVHDWGILSTLSWNIPSWSISAEFAAYLMFPFFLKLLDCRRASVARLALNVATPIIALAIVFTTAGGELGNQLLQLGVLRCLAQFSVGMTLGEVYLRRPRARWGIPWLLMALAGAMVAMVIAFRAPSALLMPTAWGLVILGLAWCPGPVNKILSAKALVVVGEASYATYMCHYLIYDLFKIMAVGRDMTASLPAIATAFAVIGVVSALLYRYVERPAQNWCIEVYSRYANARGTRAVAQSGDPHNGVH
jgi:peptidoglycan/LPS O-acetylase OafA/YrhL